jgi:uncharacterized OB-fold protein
MGDRDPIYADDAEAKKAGHKGVVAPPTMLHAWVMRGLEMADPTIVRNDKQSELHRLLGENGYPSVVATNCDQGYTRYLRPGDRISSTTVIESISEQKSTALGIGYFINTRDTFRDQNGEEVGWQTFRVLKFKAAAQPQPAASDSHGAAAKPKRLRPPLGHDNQWWWEAVGRGELLIQKCAKCSTLRHPPRPMCGECRSTEWTGQNAKGKGVVYSYTVLHYPKFPGYEFPLVCALIELEEGTRIVTNLEGIAPSEVKIGMPVTLSIENVDEELKLPVFRPAK